MILPIEFPLLFDTCEDLLLPENKTGAETPPEKQLLDRPEKLAERIAASAAAGAQAVCAPTAGASRSRLSPYGMQENVEEINSGLVLAAKSAAGTLPVGGILGPSGFFPAPYGEADFDDDIYSVYREQAGVLAGCGVDFLLLGRQVSLADMRAALLAARHTNLPVVACIAVDETGKTPTGGSLLPILITLQSMGAGAVGLNISPGPETAGEEFRHILPHTRVPLVLMADAKPGETPGAFAASVLPLFESGAGLVGTGYAVEPQHIQKLCESMKKSGSPKIPEKPDCYAAATEQEAFFLGEDIRFSEPVRCSSLLEDTLIHLEDEQVSAALIEITSVADAELLASSSSIAKLPIAVHADNVTVLEAALRYFQGRLIIDSKCLIERDSLEPLAAKYGAIIY